LSAKYLHQAAAQEHLFTEELKIEFFRVNSGVRTTNSSSNPSASRFTLKLKSGARRSPKEKPSISPSGLAGAARPTSAPRAVANPPRPQSKLGQKPGAAWSDELKHRMQKEMDVLASR
jgi:hypothetical protein